MNQVSEKWLIESQNPDTMRTIRRLFTTIKLTTLILCITWASLIIWLYQPHGLDIIRWAQSLLSLPFFHAFNMFMLWNTHRHAKRIEPQPLITYAKTIQEQLKVPDPLNIKVIHFGGYTRKLANTLMIDSKSTRIENDIYENMLAFKLATHLGVLILQVLGLSLLFLAAPLYYDWLMTTITPMLSAHPITFLPFLTLSIFYATAFIPLLLLGQLTFYQSIQPSPLKPRHITAALLILLLIPILELVIPLLFPIAAVVTILLGFFLPVIFWLLISAKISKSTWGYIPSDAIPPLYPPTTTD